MFLERYDPLKQEMVGILAPDGSCNDTLRPALDKQQVSQMYRQMWVLRLYDRKAVSLQRQGRFGTYAQMEGQEASLVASVLPLGSDPLSSRGRARKPRRATTCGHARPDSKPPMLPWPVPMPRRCHSACNSTLKSLSLP